LGYLPKKSADLNRAEVETFLKEAPNEEFLLVKVRYCIALSIILIFKLDGSWKSSTVAENYVAESMCNKIKIAKMIQCGDGIETNSNINNKENETPVVSVSNKNISLEIKSNNQKMIAGNLQMTFEKKSKCVINVYNSKN
jgi:hypothetical protein